MALAGEQADSGRLRGDDAVNGHRRAALSNAADLPDGPAAAPVRTARVRAGKTDRLGASSRGTRNWAPRKCAANQCSRIVEDKYMLWRARFGPALCQRHRREMVVNIECRYCSRCHKLHDLATDCSGFARGRHPINRKWRKSPECTYLCSAVRCQESVRDRDMLIYSGKGPVLCEAHRIAPAVLVRCRWCSGCATLVVGHDHLNACEYHPIHQRRDTSPAYEAAPAPAAAGQQDAPLTSAPISRQSSLPTINGSTDTEGDSPACKERPHAALAAPSGTADYAQSHQSPPDSIEGPTEDAARYQNMDVPHHASPYGAALAPTYDSHASSSVEQNDASMDMLLPDYMSYEFPEIHGPGYDLPDTGPFYTGYRAEVLL